MAKKKGAKGIIIGIICVIIIAAIVVAVVYFMQGDKKISDWLNIFNKTELTQEQKEEDNKAKEQEQKLLEEIAKDVEDKKPEDIIIPAGATEEEKQELQQEKEYWTVVKEVKDLINEDGMSYAKNDKSDNFHTDYELGFKSIRQIKSILYSGDSILIYCDYLYNAELNSGETVLKQNSGFISLRCKEDIQNTSYQDVLGLLRDNAEVYNISEFSEYDEVMESFFNNHIKKYGELSLLIESGKDVQILDMTYSKNANEAPVGLGFFVKIQDDQSTFYRSYTTDILDFVSSMTKEDWLEYATNDTTRFKRFHFTEYKSLDFNFEELNEKYQQK